MPVLIFSRVKVKKVDLYSAFCEYLTFNVLMHSSHSFTCKLHHTYLYLLSIH